MAGLSEQQYATLVSLRAAGLDQPARKLEGLFAQIRERPDDAQLTELIANMLRQYLPKRVDESRVNPTPEPTPAAAELTPEQPAEKAASTKPRLELVDFGFLIAMARVLQEGLAETYVPRRNPGDWQKYTPEELEIRRGSLLRHYGNGEWASVAVNAMILWWHNRRLK